MADYIDREAFLKSVLTAGIGKTIVEYSESDIGYMIRKQPAADVAPVKHCKWTCTDESAGVYNCSYCDGDFLILEGTPDDNSINYCPHCGAKIG